MNKYLSVTIKLAIVCGALVLIFVIRDWSWLGCDSTPSPVEAVNTVVGSVMDSTLARVDRTEIEADEHLGKADSLERVISRLRVKGLKLQNDYLELTTTQVTDSARLSTMTEMYQLATARAEVSEQQVRELRTVIRLKDSEIEDLRALSDVQDLALKVVEKSMRQSRFALNFFGEASLASDLRGSLTDFNAMHKSIGVGAHLKVGDFALELVPELNLVESETYGSVELRGRVSLR
jgi:hypothetical protein